MAVLHLTINIWFIRKFYTNPLACLPVLLAPVHRTVEYVEPWISSHAYLYYLYKSGIFLLSDSLGKLMFCFSQIWYHFARIQGRRTNESVWKKAVGDFFLSEWKFQNIDNKKKSLLLWVLILSQVQLRLGVCLWSLNSNLSFICRTCGLTHTAVPALIDCPNPPKTPKRRQSPKKRQVLPPKKKLRSTEPCEFHIINLLSDEFWKLWKGGLFNCTLLQFSVISCILQLNLHY